MFCYSTVCSFSLILTIFFSSDVLTQESSFHLENQCAAHCMQLLLSSTKNINNKIELCDKKNTQLSVLQSQLAVFKYKETIYENRIKEIEARCKVQDQIFADVATIKSKIDWFTPQSLIADDLKLKELEVKIEYYKAIIEKKNYWIKFLQSKLQKNQFSKSAAMVSLDSMLENTLKILESNCLTIGNSSEIREIQVPEIESFYVPCNGTIAGPGWTVIQRRIDKSVDFNRSWIEYKNGFGDLNGNLFIGLEKIYRMINLEPYELYIYLQNFRNEFRYAHYKNFSIAGEIDAYRLQSLGDYTGDAGDALYLNINMQFSTFDRDNDNRSYDNCAIERHGGWWYNQCARSNLNGRYVERELDVWDGIWWWNWLDTRSLKSVQMLIRPRTNH